MISCNITYYNEPTWLLDWYLKLKLLYERGHDIILNVADDGSKVHPAQEFFEKHPPLPNMHLFRVKEDLGFNSHGARNLLMKQTTTDWNIMSDIDRRFSMQTLTDISHRADMGKLQRGHYYSFYEILKASRDRFSVNEYLVHKKDFWKSGGYDEEFVNIHFGDRYFLEALTYTTKRICVPEWKVHYIRESRSVTWADVPTTIYPDDKTLIHPNDRWPNPEFRHELNKRIRERNKTHEGRMSKKVINFEWEQVF